MTFLMALLGSGVGVAVVTAIFQIWTTMRQGELQIIQNQLSGLYGPLYYFTCLNKALFDLYGDYQGAYGKEFKDTNIAPESTEYFKKEATAILDEANSYINTEVMQNNAKIIELLEKNWHLIDIDDVEIYSRFQIDMARLKRSEGQSFRTAISLSEHLGDVSFMRPNMIERVEAKWRLKRNRVEQLTKGTKIFCRTSG
ncbi:hypothetical protein ACFL6B_01950 [Thermodesulfobacteriota bacterium]